jgi:hypothetical protein
MRRDGRLRDHPTSHRGSDIVAIEPGYRLGHGAAPRRNCLRCRLCVPHGSGMGFDSNQTFAKCGLPRRVPVLGDRRGWRSRGRDRVGGSRRRAVAVAWHRRRACGQPDPGCGPTTGRGRNAAGVRESTGRRPCLRLGSASRNAPSRCFNRPARVDTTDIWEIAKITIRSQQYFTINDLINVRWRDVTTRQSPSAANHEPSRTVPPQPHQELSDCFFSKLRSAAAAARYGSYATGLPRTKRSLGLAAHRMVGACHAHRRREARQSTRPVAGDSSGVRYANPGRWAILRLEWPPPRWQPAPRQRRATIIPAPRSHTAGVAVPRDQNPSRSIRLRSSLRARRTASAASRARRSDGFS